jgi:mannose-1-phosphate guanylyltransferase
MKILIMAGGSGERFWPLSTKEKPKQLLPLISDKTMIRETVERLIGYVDFKDIYIATNELQHRNIMKELPEIPKDNIIIEPAFRDTAAAILYGSSYISTRNGKDSVITVLASDHLITKNEKFISSLETANKIASTEDKIITLGIKPTYPETGYGYIRVDDTTENTPNHKVRFFEKPNIEIAKKYLGSGKFLWNSGMFIFKFTTLISNFKLYSKEHLEVLKTIDSKIGSLSLLSLTKAVVTEFNTFPKISIDFAIMEKSKDVVCIPVDIGWNDIGTFDSLFNQLEQTSFSKEKNVISINSNSNLIINLSQLRISLIDIDDIMIIVNDKEILVVKKGSSSKIKELLKKL